MMLALVTGSGLFQTLAIYAIIIIAVCGVVALLWIAMRALGITPPDWFVKACWVLVIVVVMILIIKLLVYLVSGM